MRTGYSTLLGEHFGADELTKPDIRELQIVCPACFEPVFHVARGEDGAPNPYLAHYAKAKAFAEDCELRVGTMTSEHMLKSAIESRGQKLRMFMAVFRGEVTRLWLKSVQKDLRAKFKKSEVLNQIIRCSRDSMAALQPNNAGGSWAERLDKMGRSMSAIEHPNNKIDAGAQAWRSQVRIASDVLQVCLSPNGYEDFQHLYRAAAMFVIASVGNGLKAGRDIRDDRIEIAKFLTKLVMKSAAEGRRELLKAQTDILVVTEDGRPTPLYNVAQRMMFETMVYGVLAIPYLDILKRNAANRVPA